MVVMDSLNDRMRLKDKIVANVAKAVKSIQELQILSSSGTVTLGNYDWQCHRLCEHLDHTLLHGLRHVTPGYWKIVSEFTHKDCVKEIKRMGNVTTDLGRGRAWLLMALNECLLESYLRCYQQNENLVEEYYVRDALVRDQDKFNVLLTVISGLENTEFQLECDMPYLDLCVYPPNSKHTTNVESTIDFDRLSVCSMESVHVHPSRPLPQAVFETSKDVRSSRKDSTGSGDHRHSPSLDSGIHSDWNYRQRSITPIDQMSISSTSQDCESSEGAGLEVIHLSKKGKPHKNKKKRKKFVSVSNISEPDINEIYDAVEGPVIKIPPIDDIKFSSALMNNQNNNEPDSLPGLLSEENHLQISRTRSPGDGMENDTDRADGNSKSDKHTDDKSSSCSSKDKYSLDDINDSEDKKTGTHVSNEPESKRTDAADLKETKSEEKPKVEESIFTKLIEARVTDMVKAGEQIENEEKVTEQAPDHYTDIGDVPKDGKDVFEYSKDSDAYYADIYNESRSAKEKEILEDVEEVDTFTDKVEEVVPEVPSIYSKIDESDLSSEDEAESFPSNFDAKNKLFNNGTFSRQSNSSTPVSDFKNLGNNFEKRRLSDDLDKISVSSEKVSLRNHSAMKTPHSDSNLYGTLSNRNTPDMISANQKRCKSAMSNSSAIETEDEILANMKSSNSRSSSRMSTNEMPVYRNSPYPSTDEDKLSINTHSSNQSPSTDMEGSGQVLQAKVEELIVQKKLNQYTHLTFEDDLEDDDDDGDFDQLPTPIREGAPSLKPGEIVLDNNTMLYLMLEVLDENDTIVKMFTCQQGHTEGKIKSTLVLISMDNLYFVEPLQAKNKFSKQAVISYKNIDFVSIGFNNQILHIACKNKRQKYWLTPGEERITIAMVDCLADSMEKSDSKPGRLEVDTGNTIQKISLQKYIAYECKCESDEAEVVCYSLVHWEDPTSDKGSCEWDREGILCYKSVETTNILGSQTWRTAYAALRDSMLCLYNDKNDAKPSQFLSMGGGQCVGCKRDFNADKNHAIKIMLSDGSFWSIALNSEEEANRWLQGLCQAVSEGMKMSSVRASCVPCCMVLCKQKLLMCHEDLDTNFIRTLGSANLHDITSVLYDDLHTSYLVLVFESDEERISSEKWVLYFNSGHECNRFKTALSDCWFNHFQVEVPVLPIDDFSLQKKCTEMVQHLKSSLTLNNR